jgi:hypothetical protein
METSNRSLRIELDPDLLEQLRALNKPQRREIGGCIEEARVTFGRPHLHRGAGIRVLKSGVYECRISLQQRLIFTADKGVLYFHFIGNHNEVSRFLRNL